MKTLLLVLLLSLKAQAYPEMIKHGYQSCTACHFSPSGGGILNQYGKMISKELLPTMNIYREDTDEEEKWFHIAGKTRHLQLNQDNDIIKNKMFIPMQLDLEAAVVIKNWVVTTTAGLYKPRGKSESESEPISRRHYVMYKGENNWNVRAGRFYPMFGILTPDHSKIIKKSIGFDQGQETYNLEASYFMDSYEFFLTAITGRAMQQDIYSAEGYTASISKNFGDRYKVGLHNMGIKDRTIERRTTSLSGSLGITEKLHILSENTRIISEAGISKTSTWATNQVASFEVYKGIIPYVGYEFERSVSKKTLNRYAGITLFPINHFEFKFEFQKREYIRPSKMDETMSLFQVYAYF
ncbi:MAG: hypothetical protein V4596_02205 [Bdellovibrionota bacterium]